MDHNDLVTARVTRVKRTEKDMLRSVKGNTLSEAHYVLERIRKLEDKMTELLASVSQEARELILQGRPDLGNY